MSEGDVTLIHDEDLLRRMWQQTEDFSRKKEIRAHMYRLREERLRNLYSPEPKHEGKGNEFMAAQDHVKSFADQTFQSMKSKEVRDAGSPPKEFVYRGQDLKALSNAGWNVEQENKTTDDGHTHVKSVHANIEGRYDVDGGKVQFAAVDHHKEAITEYHDENSSLKRNETSSNTAGREHVVRKTDDGTQISSTTSSSTSTSKFQQMSSMRHEPVPYLTNDDYDLRSYDTNRNEENSSVTKRQITKTNEYEDNTKKQYEQISRKGDYYDQTVEKNDYETGELLSRKVDYPDNNTRVIVETRCLPDGTRVTSTKREFRAPVQSSHSERSYQTKSENKSYSTHQRLDSRDSSENIRHQNDNRDCRSTDIVNSQRNLDDYDFKRQISENTPKYDDDYHETKINKNVKDRSEKKGDYSTTQHITKINRTVHDQSHKSVIDDSKIQRNDIKNNQQTTDHSKIDDSHDQTTRHVIKTHKVIESAENDNHVQSTTETTDDQRDIITSHDNYMRPKDSENILQTMDTRPRDKESHLKDYEPKESQTRARQPKDIQNRDYQLRDNDSKCYQTKEKDAKEEVYNITREKKIEETVEKRTNTEQYHTTYQTDFSQKKISMDWSPSHTAWASTLRADTPPTTRPSTRASSPGSKTFKSSTSSLRSSVSPDKSYRKPSSRGSSPNKIDKSSPTREISDRHSTTHSTHFLTETKSHKYTNPEYRRPPTGRSPTRPGSSPERKSQDNRQRPSTSPEKRPQDLSYRPSESPDRKTTPKTLRDISPEIRSNRHSDHPNSPTQQRTSPNRFSVSPDKIPASDYPKENFLLRSRQSPDKKPEYQKHIDGHPEATSDFPRTTSFTRGYQPMESGRKPSEAPDRKPDITAMTDKPSDKLSKSSPNRKSVSPDRKPGYMRPTSASQPSDSTRSPKSQSDKSSPTRRVHSPSPTRTTKTTSKFKEDHYKFIDEETKINTRSSKAQKNYSKHTPNIPGPPINTKDNSPSLSSESPDKHLNDITNKSGRESPSSKIVNDKCDRINTTVETTYVSDNITTTRDSKKDNHNHISSGKKNIVREPSPSKFGTYEKKKTYTTDTVTSTSTSNIIKDTKEIKTNYLPHRDESPTKTPKDKDNSELTEIAYFKHTPTSPERTTLKSPIKDIDETSKALRRESLSPKRRVIDSEQYDCVNNFKTIDITDNVTPTHHTSKDSADRSPEDKTNTPREPSPSKFATYKKKKPSPEIINVTSTTTIVNTKYTPESLMSVEKSPTKTPEHSGSPIKKVSEPSNTPTKKSPERSKSPDDPTPGDTSSVIDRKHKHTSDFLISERSTEVINKKTKQSPRQLITPSSSPTRKQKKPDTEPSTGQSSPTTSVSGFVYFSSPRNENTVITDLCNQENHITHYEQYFDEPNSSQRRPENDMKRSPSPSKIPCRSPSPEKRISPSDESLPRKSSLKKPSTDVTSSVEKPPSSFRVSPTIDSKTLPEHTVVKKDRPEEPQSKSPIKVKPPLERRETYEDRCRKILGMTNETTEKIQTKDTSYLKEPETIISSPSISPCRSPVPKDISFEYPTIKKAIDTKINLSDFITHEQENTIKTTSILQSDSPSGDDTPTKLLKRVIKEEVAEYNTSSHDHEENNINSATRQSPEKTPQSDDIIVKKGKNIKNKSADNERPKAEYSGPSSSINLIPESSHRLDGSPERRPVNKGNEKSSIEESNEKPSKIMHTTTVSSKFDRLKDTEEITVITKPIKKKASQPSKSPERKTPESHMSRTCPDKSPLRQPEQFIKRDSTKENSPTRSAYLESTISMVAEYDSTEDLVETITETKETRYTKPSKSPTRNSSKPLDDSFTRHTRASEKSPVRKSTYEQPTRINPEEAQLKPKDSSPTRPGYMTTTVPVISNEESKTDNYQKTVSDTVETKITHHQKSLSPTRKETLHHSDKSPERKSPQVRDHVSPTKSKLDKNFNDKHLKDSSITQKKPENVPGYMKTTQSVLSKHDLTVSEESETTTLKADKHHHHPSDSPTHKHPKSEDHPSTNWPSLSVDKYPKEKSPSSSYSQKTLQDKKSITTGHNIHGSETTIEDEYEVHTRNIECSSSPHSDSFTHENQKEHIPHYMKPISPHSHIHESNATSEDDYENQQTIHDSFTHMPHAEPIPHYMTPILSHLHKSEAMITNDKVEKYNSTVIKEKSVIDGDSPVRKSSKEQSPERKINNKQSPDSPPRSTREQSPSKSIKITSTVTKDSKENYEESTINKTGRSLSTHTSGHKTLRHDDSQYKNKPLRVSPSCDNKSPENLSPTRLTTDKTPGYMHTTISITSTEDSQESLNRKSNKINAQTSRPSDNSPTRKATKKSPEYSHPEFLSKPRDTLVKISQPKLAMDTIFNKQSSSPDRELDYQKPNTSVIINKQEKIINENDKIEELKEINHSPRSSISPSRQSPDKFNEAKSSTHLKELEASRQLRTPSPTKLTSKVTEVNTDFLISEREQEILDRVQKSLRKLSPVRKEKSPSRERSPGKITTSLQDIDITTRTVNHNETVMEELTDLTEKSTTKIHEVGHGKPKGEETAKLLSRNVSPTKKPSGIVSSAKVNTPLDSSVKTRSFSPKKLMTSATERPQSPHTPKTSGIKPKEQIPSHLTRKSTSTTSTSKLEKSVSDSQKITGVSTTTKQNSSNKVITSKATNKTIQSPTGKSNEPRSPTPKGNRESAIPKKETESKVTRAISDITIQTKKISPTSPQRFKSKPEIKVSDMATTKTSSKIQKSSLKETKSMLPGKPKSATTLNRPDDEDNIIIDVQQSKSSRENSPDRICPTPVNLVDESGIPRYPDEVNEPDDGFYRHTHQTIHETESIVDDIVEICEDDELFVRKSDKEQFIEEDESLLSVTDRVSKFTKAINTTKKPTDITNEFKHTEQKAHSDFVEENLKSDECLLSVSEKVNKFAKGPEDTNEKSPARKVADEYDKDTIYIDDYTKLSVHDKAHLFVETAENVKTPKAKPTPQRIERPDLTNVEESLKSDDCLLSVSDKVHKFVKTAEQFLTETTEIDDKEKRIKEQHDKIMRKIVDSDDITDEIDKFTVSDVTEEDSSRNTPDDSNDKHSYIKETMASQFKNKGHPRPNQKPTERVPTVKITTLRSSEAVKKAKALFENIASTTPKPKEVAHPKRIVKLGDVSVIKKSPKADSTTVVHPSMEKESSNTIDVESKIDAVPHHVKDHSFGDTLTRTQHICSDDKPRLSPSRLTTQSPDRQRPKSPLRQTAESTTITKTKSEKRPILPRSQSPLHDIESEKPEKVPGYLRSTKTSQLKEDHTKVIEENEMKSSRRGSGKFGVELRRTSVERSTTSSERRRSIEHPCIEDIFDLDLLEQMLEKVVGYEQRRRIRAQIRIARKKSETDYADTYTRTTKQTTTIQKTRSPDRHQTTLSADTLKLSPHRSVSPDPHAKTIQKTVPERMQHKDIVQPVLNGHAKELKEVSEKRQRPQSPEKAVTKLTSQKSPTRQPSPDKKTRNNSPTKAATPKPTANRFNEYASAYIKKVGLGEADKPKFAESKKKTTQDQKTTKQLKEHKIIEEYSTSKSVTERTSSKDIEVIQVNDRKRPASPEKRLSPEPKSQSPERILERSPSPVQKKQPVHQTKSEPKKKETIIKTVYDIEKKIPQKQEDKPSWITNRNLKKITSESRTFSSKKIDEKPKYRAASPSKIITKPIDVITSSYGPGPLDADGKPLFGIKALRNGASNYQVKGTVIRQEYHSRNGGEPEGTVSVTAYSTEPEELERLLQRQGEKPSRIHGLAAITTTRKFGGETGTTLKEIHGKEERAAIDQFTHSDQRISNTRVEDITENFSSRQEIVGESKQFETRTEEFFENITKDSTDRKTEKMQRRVEKVERKGDNVEKKERTDDKKTVRQSSVKSLTEKYIKSANESSKTEKVTYPKAGLILRTASMKDNISNDSSTHAGLARTDSEHSLSSVEDTVVTTEKCEGGVRTITTTRTHAHHGTNMEKGQKVEKSFLNSNTKVTGVQDILTRMKNADIVIQEGDSSEDTEARALLNKFLGATVLMAGMQSYVTEKPTGKVVVKQETVRTSSGGAGKVINSQSCSVQEFNVDQCWDERLLRQLLDECSDYEQRRRIRSRIRTLMAEQEACATAVTEALAAAGETPEENNEAREEEEVTITSSVRRDSSDKTVSSSTTTTKTTKVTESMTRSAPKPVSPFAKFRQLEKQNSTNSPNSASPKSPGSPAPYFKFTEPALQASAVTIKERLLQWCRDKTRDYENVKLENFSTSWADGLAFCALLHHFLPDAFDYSKLSKETRRQNFTLAFKIADEKAGIYPLLDVDDMVAMRKPDWKCVFTYVQSIHRRFRDHD